RRTAATVAALIVAVASIAAVASYATSWQGGGGGGGGGGRGAGGPTRRGATRATGGGPDSPFDPTVAADLRRVDGVRQVVEVRTGQARVQGAETAIDAVDPDAIGQALQLRLRIGGLAALRHATVLVSAGQARRHALKAGDMMTIELPRSGPAPYRIAGVYDDTPLLACYLLDLGTYAAGYARQRTTAAYLLTEPGTDLSDQGPLLGRD